MTRSIQLFLGILVMSLLAGLTSQSYPQITFVILLGFTIGATYLAIFVRRAKPTTR